MNNYIHKAGLSILLFILTATISLSAQNEGSNWVFGDYAGLTWNTTTTRSATVIYGGSGSANITVPTNLSSPKLTTTEGCFAYSDKNGQLLFYSDGTRLWRGDHTQVSVTMTGNYSSAQSGIVFPYPGKTNQYIAVTVPWNAEASPKLAFTVIEASTPSNATVISSNTLLQGYKGDLMVESVQAIRHANGTDFWIIAPGSPRISGATDQNTYLNVWEVTSSGVASTAPAKTIRLPKSTLSSSRGYLKFSSGGNYFAWGTWSRGVLYYGRFDPATGEFSSIGYVDRGNGNDNFYGVEFSPTGKYLYVSPATTSGRSKIVERFNFEQLLNSGNTTTEGIITNTYAGTYMGALQLGIDGRIYAVENNTSHLYIIDQPDSQNPKVYKLNNYLNGTGKLGLPTFSASFFLPGEITLTGNSAPCKGSSETYTATITPQGTGEYKITHIQWYVNDVIQGAPKAISGNSSTFTYSFPSSATGNYIIKAVQCGTIDGNPTEIGGAKTLTATPQDCNSNPDIEEVTGNLSVCKSLTATNTYSIRINGLGAGNGLVKTIGWDFGNGSTATTTVSATGTYTQNVIYKKAGTYTLTITPYNSSNSPIIGEIQTKTIVVKPCVLPVNPKIHLYK
jgi:hypothetical protein